MRKQYQVIGTINKKHLQPINVPYPNADQYDDETGMEPHPDEVRADAVIYEERTRPVPYIGTRKVGETVDESEVREVKQHNVYGVWTSHPFMGASFDRMGYETRTAFTDVEPTQFVDRRPLSDHLRKNHGLALTSDELDKIIALSAYILK